MQYLFNANFGLFTSSSALVCSLASQHSPPCQQMLAKNGWSPQLSCEERGKVEGFNKKMGCMLDENGRWLLMAGMLLMAPA